MLYNPKYVSFQGQTYIQYTGSIENTELRNIPNVLETTINTAIMICGACFFLLALLIIPYRKDVSK